MITFMETLTTTQQLFSFLACIVMVSIHLGRWSLTVILYILIVSVIFYFRPALMFDASGNPKAFAANQSPTTSPFAPAVVFPLLAIILYFMVAVFELVMA